MKQADSLWKAASCVQCLIPTQDYDKEFVRNNITNDFYDFYLKNYETCIDDYQHQKNPNVTFCVYCVRNYTLLNEFYDQVTKHNDQNICFDVTDKVSPGDFNESS